MVVDMVIKVLKGIGFTQGESKIYLALLDIGETTTGEIIKKSGISGSKVYEILEKLIEKGLVSHVIKEKTKYFQASSPKRLLDYLSAKEKELIDDRKEIENIIPKLEARQKSKQKIQSSQIFEGYEGIKTVFNLILESLKSGEEYYAFSFGDELQNKQFTLFLENYHQKRIKKRIKVKIIARTEDKKLSFFNKLNKMKGSEVKYYKNPFPLGVIIFKDRVATLTFKEKPTVFLLKSEQIYNSYKDFFLYLWKVSQIR
jgi:sugar-specific transcriptional regulator TrmB